MYENKSFLQPNKLVALIGYIFIFFVGSSIITTLIIKIYSLFSNDSFQELFNLIVTTDDFEKLTDIQLRNYAMINSIANFTIYLFLTIFVCFYMRDLIKLDFEKFNNEWQKYLGLLVIFTIGFYSISFLIEYIISLFVSDTSSNQESIIIMIKNGGAFFVFLNVVLFAPIVEELIYRKIIFSLLERKPIYLSYIVSSFTFALPHMFSTKTNIIDWFLLLIPYLSSALLLCTAYHLSKKNIFITIGIHLINNLIAFIIIYGGL